MRAGEASRASSAALQLADAVLGGDRAAGRGHQIVDEAGDPLAFALIPAGRRAIAGAHVEMDIAVAKMAEGAGGDSGEGALDGGGGADDEGGMAATGTDMSCAKVWPSARSASEIQSRMRQNASAWASLAAITASPIRPCASASPSSASIVASSALAGSLVVASISTFQHACRRAAGGCRECVGARGRANPRDQLEPLDAARARLEEAQQLERSCRAVDADPSDAARRDGGD